MKPPFQAVKGVSFSIPENKTVALVGEVWGRANQSCRSQ